MELAPPNHHPARGGDGGQKGIILEVGNATIGSHLSGIILQPITDNSPGDKNAILNGTGSPPHHFPT